MNNNNKKKNIVILLLLLILSVVVLGHGSHSHAMDENEHPYLKQMKNYMQKNVENKYAQVGLSIFIISFPSIPVFLSLSFLGRVLKKKGDKNNFSSTLLNLLLAFACGTLLGDVMLHILPYLFSSGNGHSHDHSSHGHGHSVIPAPHVHTLNHAHTHAHETAPKTGGCPFAHLFGTPDAKIPTDAAHAHLHENHQHTHEGHAHTHDDHAHDHAHENHAHDHAHENHQHDHAHDHDHNHHHHETPQEQVHEQLKVLNKEGEQHVHDHNCQHSHDHDHDHHHDHHDHHHEGGHGHSHSIEEMVVPLMIIGGIVLFISLDYIFMKIHVSATPAKKVSDSKKSKDNKNKQESESKQLEKKKQGNKKESEEKTNENEECEEDNDGHHHHHHHHSHSHDEHEEHSAVPFLIGDFLHNFTDGLAIGAAYTVSFNMGVTSTFVIMIHELPHEIGDFAHLIKYNYTLGNILKTQFLTSLGALIGGFLGLMTGEIYKRELLSITAGGFLYMCLANVIPEIQAELRKDHSLKNLISVIISISVGVGLMYYVALLE